MSGARGRVHRLARLVRLREIEERQAQAAQASARAELEQATAMRNRIRDLQSVYAPAAGSVASITLQATGHQRDRLHVPAQRFSHQEAVARYRLESRLDATVAASLRRRQAEKLADQQRASEDAAAERKTEMVQAEVARTLARRTQSAPR